MSELKIAEIFLENLRENIDNIPYRQKSVWGKDNFTKPRYLLAQIAEFKLSGPFTFEFLCQYLSKEVYKAYFSKVDLLVLPPSLLGGPWAGSLLTGRNFQKMQADLLEFLRNLSALCKGLSLVYADFYAKDTVFSSRSRIKNMIFYAGICIEKSEDNLYHLPLIDENKQVSSSYTLAFADSLPDFQVFYRTLPFTIFETDQPASTGANNSDIKADLTLIYNYGENIFPYAGQESSPLFHYARLYSQLNKQAVLVASLGPYADNGEYLYDGRSVIFENGIQEAIGGSEFKHKKNSTCIQTSCRAFLDLELISSQNTEIGTRTSALSALPILPELYLDVENMVRNPDSLEEAELIRKFFKDSLAELSSAEILRLQSNVKEYIVLNDLDELNDELNKVHVQSPGDKNTDKNMDKNVCEKADEHASKNITQNTDPMPLVNLLVKVYFYYRQSPDLQLSFYRNRKLFKNPWLPLAGEESSPQYQASCLAIIEHAACALASRLMACGSAKVVLGLSGGLDSSLALIIAAECMKILDRDLDNILCIGMPGFGTGELTKNNAASLLKFFPCRFRQIDITEACRRHFKDIDHDEACHDLCFENAQARERTQILMDIANKEGGIVLGTGDMSEMALGWCTYNGDHMSMYGVNSNLPKSLIRVLLLQYALHYDQTYKTDGNSASLTEAVRKIIETPVSPELLPCDNEGKITQATEEILGPYELLDFFMYYHVVEKASTDKILFLAEEVFAKSKLYSPEIILQSLANFYRRFFASQFKRSCQPDAVKVFADNFSKTSYFLSSQGFDLCYGPKLAEIQRNFKSEKAEN